MPEILNSVAFKIKLSYLFTNLIKDSRIWEIDVRDVDKNGERSYGRIR